MSGALKVTDFKLRDMKITDEMERCETDGANVELISYLLTPSTPSDYY